MRKKLAVISMLLIFSISMTGCSWSDFTSKLPWKSSKSEYDPEDYLTKLGDYKGVEVDVTVTDDEVQSELDTLLQSKQETVKVKGRKVAKDGDVVSIDFEGTVNKKKFDGGTGSDPELTLGSGKMVPGFEKGIVGMKIGQTKNVKVTFPKDYSTKNLQGKKANFKIKLKAIKETITPKATDKNIAKFTDSEYKTLDAYKEGTKNKLKQTKKDKVNETAYTNYTKSVEIQNPPEELLKKYKDYYDKYWKSYLKYYGYDFDTFLTQQNMTEEDYQKQLGDIAKDLTKNFLIVQYIADKEGIKITDKDKEAHIKELNTMYGTEDKAALEKMIKEYYGMELDNYVTDDFYEKKVAEVIGKNAKFKE